MLKLTPVANSNMTMIYFDDGTAHIFFDKYEIHDNCIVNLYIEGWIATSLFGDAVTSFIKEIEKLEANTSQLKEYNTDSTTGADEKELLAGGCEVIKREYPE